jgi:hypothetical protein
MVLRLRNQTLNEDIKLQLIKELLLIASISTVILSQFAHGIGPFSQESKLNLFM